MSDTLSFLLFHFKIINLYFNSKVKFSKMLTKAIAMVIDKYQTLV